MKKVIKLTESQLKKMVKDTINEQSTKDYFAVYEKAENIKLKPTKDILAQLGRMKTKKQFLVGFALETSDEENNALKKLHSKNLDLIVLNSLQDKGAGFGFDTSCSYSHE
jgi:phosphopantothenoylcysteine synthetase/decarboxylase